MMKYKGYFGKVEFDAEADILHGEVIGIRDVVTFEGKSTDEIRLAFTESVDDYLAFCDERGEQPDKPCSGKFVVRLDSDLHQRVSTLAGISGKSLNAFVTECLEKEVATATRPHGQPKPRTGQGRAKVKPAAKRVAAKRAAAKRAPALPRQRKRR